jgi:hypothetical protein
MIITIYHIIVNLFDNYEGLVYYNYKCSVFMVSSYFILSRMLDYYWARRYTPAKFMYGHL